MAAHVALAAAALADSAVAEQHVAALVVAALAAVVVVSTAAVAAVTGNTLQGKQERAGDSRQPFLFVRWIASAVAHVEEA
jgi:hypothetical protein